MIALGTKYNFIQSVGRAFAILEQFHTDRALGVTAIANRVGLHKSTCFGLLHTLQQLGYIQRNPETGLYSLGVKMFQLGQDYIIGLDLRTCARPLLVQIVEKFQGTAHLVVVEGRRAVYIDKVEPTQAMAISSRIGQEAPLHCSGVGKVMLAFMSEEECAAVINAGLRQYTEKTITGKTLLLEELCKIRQQGFGTDNEELEMGLRCVAAPIFNARKQAIAAVSISGPSSRLDFARLDEFSAMVKSCTEEVSRQLGYRP